MEVKGLFYCLNSDYHPKLSSIDWDNDSITIIFVSNQINLWKGYF